MPITWRTFMGQSLAQAAQPMQNAVDTLSSGFDGMSKLVKEAQLVNQGVADRAREGTVQSLLDHYQGATTEQQALALREDPTTAALRAQLDPRDLARVRGADEARLAGVRTLEVAGRAAADATSIFNNRGVVADAAAQAAVLNDPARLGEVLKMLPPDHPQRAELTQKYASMVMGNQKSDLDLRVGNQYIKASDANIDVNKRNATVNEGQLTVAQTNATTGQTNAKTAQQNADTNANQLKVSFVNALDSASGGAGGAGAGAANGQAALSTNLTAAFKDDPAKAQTMSRLMAEALNHPDPAKAAALRDLPMDVKLAVAQEASNMAGTGKYNPSDMGAAGRIQAKLLEQLTNPSVVSQMTAESNARKTANERRAEAASARATLMNELFPGSKKAADATRAAAGGPDDDPDAYWDPNDPKNAVSPDGKTAPAGDAKPAKLTPKQNLLSEQITLEREEIRAGLRKGFSAEIKRSMEQADEATAQAVSNAVASGATRAGAAFKDVATFVPRLGMKAVDMALGGINTVAGTNLPQDQSNNLVSLTPFSDELNIKGVQLDLKRRRAAFEKAMAEAKNKKDW